MAMQLGTRMMIFLSKRMIACDEASFLVSYRSDHRLGFLRWWQLKMHLISCHLCRKYSHQVVELNQSFEVYRAHSSHESCSHKLSSEAGTRIGQTFDQELNAK
jgi:hypothetical protein